MMVTIKKFVGFKSVSVKVAKLALDFYVLETCLAVQIFLYASNSDTCIVSVKKPCHYFFMSTK